MGSTDYTLVVDPVGDALASTKACEEDVFLEAYGNTTEQWVEEYGEYDARSIFLGVLDNNGHAVGAARLIMPGERPVKSIADMSRSPWEIDGARSARAAGIDTARTWDIATLAVRRRQGRGGLISAALYHGLIHTLRDNRARSIIMIMDARARRLLDMNGLRTNVLPGTAPGSYLGSPTSVPLWANLTTIMDNQRRINPDAHRLIDQGIGLDGVSLPSSFVLTRPTADPSQRPILRSV